MARMKYHYKATQHKANFISVVCFLLFVTYSILLYIKHQYGIVAMTYFVESELLTSDFSPSATWITENPVFSINSFTVIYFPSD